MDDLERQERAREVEAIKLEANLRRSPTWKRIEADLQDQRNLLEARAGDTGLSNGDRAMMQGRLAQILDCLLLLPRRAVERELADRSPSPEADDPVSSLPEPIHRPELM